MRKLTNISIILLLCSGIVYGQTTPPTSVVIDSKTYYQHGYNSVGGPDRPEEIRDSVTVTSVSKYFVLPNPFVSPLYNPTNALVFTNVNSTFPWTLRNSLGTITNGNNTPLITVTWGNTTGIDSVRVTETPTQLGAVCIGSGTSIPVAVIAKPTIAFNQVNSAYADSTCFTPAELLAGVLRNFAVTATTQSAQLQVDYTVTRNGVAYPALNGTNVPVAVGGNISITFSEYGRYEITITKITDRVSRNSFDAAGNSIVGDITTAGARFVYHVMPPVQTGPIFRLPNRF